MIRMSLFALLLVMASAQASELVEPVLLSAALNGEQQADGSLRIAASADAPFQPLFAIDRPEIDTPVYAIRGMVRTAAVGGTAYLQMDSHFAGNRRFFSKTLADTGPLASLQGDSEWRPFVLPFKSGNGGDVQVPEKLTLGVYLPAGGEVYLRGIELHEYAAGEDPLGGTAWPANRVVTLAVAVGGALVGLWGALIGILVPRARGRAFVIGSANLLILIGALLLICGTELFVAARPLQVHYALLLGGAVLVAVVVPIRRLLPERYRHSELQKMQAMDV